MEPREGTIVRAGGGIVNRRPAGPLELAIIHRPHREDWSFPKGKVDPDETVEEAALREVFEETGFHCRIKTFVGHTEYRDRKDRPKIVAYWVMDPVSGSFRPSEEVDELRWLGIDEASALLSYERDRQLLAAVRALDELSNLE